MMDDITTLLASHSLAKAEALATSEIKRQRDELTTLLMLRSFVRQQHGSGGSLCMALADAKEAIRLNPRQPVGYLQAGFVLSDLEVFDSAEAMFKMAVAKSSGTLNGKLDEQILWARFMKRLLAMEEAGFSGYKRLSVEQQLLETVSEQSPSVVDLIPSEEEQKAVENKHFKDNAAKGLLESHSKKQLDDQQSLDGCELSVSSQVEDDEKERLFSKFGRIVEQLEFGDKSIVIFTFASPNSVASAIEQLDGKAVAGFCADNKPLNLDILPKLKRHLPLKCVRDEENKRKMDDKKPNGSATISWLKSNATDKMKAEQKKSVQRP